MSWTVNYWIDNTISPRLIGLIGWRRSRVVELGSKTGELSLSCAWPIVDGQVTTLWINCPLWVSQRGHLSLSSLRSQWMSSNSIQKVGHGGKRQMAWWEVWSTAHACAHVIECSYAAWLKCARCQLKTMWTGVERPLPVWAVGCERAHYSHWVICIAVPLIGLMGNLSPVSTTRVDGPS